MIKIKRVYETQDKTDGYRVLVDRLWPRGIKKSDLAYDEWPKELCPSTELRKDFAHDPLKFKELANISARAEIKALAKLAAKQNVTLLYAAHDEKINHAIILKEIIQRMSKV
jgi:uncharacterized protein YeaO (DUF488 family)